MIVHDFDILRRIGPPEAHPPLIIDSNAPLPLTLARELLEPVGRRTAQVAKARRCVEHLELTFCNRSEGPQPGGTTALIECLRRGIPEALDHGRENLPRDGKCQGRTTIAHGLRPLDPRIAVELILEKLAAGESVEQLLEEHPRLTGEAVRAALEFAAAALKADVVYPTPAIRK